MLDLWYGWLGSRLSKQISRHDSRLDDLLSKGLHTPELRGRSPRVELPGKRHMDRDA